MNGRTNYYSPWPSKKKSQTVKRGKRIAKVEKDGGEGKSASLSHLQGQGGKVRQRDDVSEQINIRS